MASKEGQLTCVADLDGSFVSNDSYAVSRLIFEQSADIPGPLKLPADAARLLRY